MAGSLKLRSENATGFKTHAHLGFGMPHP